MRGSGDGGSTDVPDQFGAFGEEGMGQWIPQIGGDASLDFQTPDPEQIQAGSNDDLPNQQSPLEWPELPSAQQSPQMDFEMPQIGESLDSSFSAYGGFEQPSAEGFSFANTDQPIDDSTSYSFPEALRSVMSSGEMGDRTTISETAITEHGYHGPIGTVTHSGQ